MPDLPHLPDPRRERDDAVRTLKAVLEVAGDVAVTIGDPDALDRLLLVRTEIPGSDVVRFGVVDPAQDRRNRLRAGMAAAGFDPDDVDDEDADRILEELDR